MTGCLERGNPDRRVSWTVQPRNQPFFLPKLEILQKLVNCTKLSVLPSIKWSQDRSYPLPPSSLIAKIF